MQQLRIITFIFAAALTAITFTSEKLHAQWVLTGYIGTTHTQTGPLTLDHPTNRTRVTLIDVSWEGRSFKRPLYWGGRAGYFLWKVGIFEVGPEFEWIHLKVYLKTQESTEVEGFIEGEPVATVMPVHQLIDQFSISHGTNLLLGNLAFRSDFLPGPPWTDKQIQLMGRIGYGANLSHFEGAIAGGDYSEYYGFGGDAFQVGVGLSVPLAGPLYGMAEYKFTTTGPKGHVSNTAEIGADLNTHHLVFGLSFQFN